ncbi:olfactory receptor 10AG1-like [Patagioenas fasciata]|uniref:olfactory receptor 10AG1-like n=1 Tax=Patagioenas fasciata TaxID=372321 RepID=UPI0032E8ED3E
MDVKGNKKGFKKYIGDKKKAGKNVGLMLKGVVDLVTQNTEKAEIDHGDWERSLSTEKASVTPLVKKGRKEDPRNYGPVSLTIIPWKMMEHIILETISRPLQDKKSIRSHQHGFTTGKSHLTSLLMFYSEMTRLADEGREVDIFFLCFRKVFDTVSSKIFIGKLLKYCLDEQTVRLEVFVILDKPSASSKSLLFGLLCIGKMPQRKGLENHTVGSGFILVGFSDHSSLQGLCFTVFLAIYLMVLTGNSLIALITVVDSSLHTPMYFFLRNFSILEICYTSVTLPKMLVGFLMADGRISFLGCAAQMYFLVLLGSIKCLFLAAMAYYRYIAICDPLHYTLIMSRGLCVRMVVGSWVIVVPVQIRQTYHVFTLPFCASHDLHHFFCDVTPLLKLACADTFWNEVTLYALVLVFVILSFSLIILSYIKIIKAILKILSVLGRRKAFSTCSSHLGVVTLFFGSATDVYLKQWSRDSIDTDKYFALIYIIVTPMFNLLIYSLRNKEVKIALKRLLWTK